jgi:hypothetical protein
MKSLFHAYSGCSRWTGWFSRGASAVAVLMFCWCHGAETNRPPVQVVFPKSVFVDDPNGKDPFFPTRNRGPVAVVPKTAPVSKEPNWKAVQLRGIIGSGDQRFALINNLPFAKGEEGEVKIGNSKIKIKVIEVKEKSVVVFIEGVSDQKELLLPDRVLGVGSE